MIPDKYSLKLPKAILFDWDNTLVDTWRTVFEAINFSREAVGHTSFSIEEFWQRPHHSMRDTADELFGIHVEKGMQIFYEVVEKSHLHTLSVLDGAESLLKNLQSKNIYLGIVSNKDGHYLRKEIDHLRWDHHFTRVIGARDTAADKPSPIPVLAALQDSAIVPSHDVWFVGDSIVDVHCARASGCVPIVVGQGEASLQEDIIHVGDCSGLETLIAKFLSI